MPQSPHPATLLPSQDQEKISPPLRIGGYLPLSATDYPGCLSAVIFLRGCPWRCPYCHNPELQPFVGPNTPPWQQILVHLQKRRNKLDAVVFSGGEPCAQPALLEAIQEIRSIGFRIGIHTAGSYPNRLAQLLPLLDWVGLDVKAPPGPLFNQIAGSESAADAFLQSLSLLRNSKVPFELRTTQDKSLLPDNQIQILQNWLAEQGLPPSRIQPALPVRKLPPPSPHTQA